MTQLKIGSVLQRLFPSGTQQESEVGLSQPPSWPPDLFAAGAYLLQLAGAYHYLVPNGVETAWPTSCFCISDTDLESWREAGKTWRESALIPALVSEIWDRLITAQDQDVYRDHAQDTPAPPWWHAAQALLVIADEACLDVGYLGVTASATNWVAKAVYMATFKSYIAYNVSHVRIRPQAASLCIQADRDVVCVQPKARTPNVGCTMRTLSHNLSLLPPRGIMRAHWQKPPVSQLPESGTTLNLLLIPFPFFIEANSFSYEPAVAPTTSNGRSSKPAWGWFTLRQDWLRPQLIDFTFALLEKAIEETGVIHGIVFPEYSLDWKTYEELANRLRDEAPDIEFLISGTSGNCNGERGNYAMTSQFFLRQEDGAIKQRIVATTSRPKHHRWRLEETQIANYALNTLQPKTILWEKIHLPQREIHVNAVRSASVFTTMICEDLARSDPCHEVLRSLGPNLVFVLLMDGPQMGTRWPSRYATGLAEDPGSSVLTLTSRGLIQRSNENREEKNWSIGIWKDDSGKTTTIECTPDKHGVVLMLNGVEVAESTLEDRQQMDSYAWRLNAKPRQVGLLPDHPALKALLAR